MLGEEGLCTTAQSVPEPPFQRHLQRWGAQCSSRSLSALHPSILHSPPLSPIFPSSLSIFFFCFDSRPIRRALLPLCLEICLLFLFASFCLNYSTWMYLFMKQVCAIENDIPTCNIYLCCVCGVHGWWFCPRVWRGQGNFTKFLCPLGLSTLCTHEPTACHSFSSAMLLLTGISSA